ncbi:MAG: cardiolipin synthase [Verrucomicrobiota bacterium]
MMNLLPHPSSLLILLHLLVVVGFSIRVIMQRPATGVALAWLFFIAAVPLAGSIAYLLVGEKRIPPERKQRLARLRESYADLVAVLSKEKLSEVDWDRHPQEAEEMDQLGRRLVGLPTVSGSTGRLFSETELSLQVIAGDVDAARYSVLMEFYIWNEGGLADEVLDAVIRAARRGVVCRLLIDELGASAWWKKSEQPGRLREAGVYLQAALPVGIFRTIFGRNDVRLHRKIVIIDGEIAWTGSMNMVDPRYFKQDANVGEWVDAMVRVEGAIVTPLALTMIGDWTLETGESVEEIAVGANIGVTPAKGGDGDAQIVPSGPGQTDDGLLQMLLATIGAAREELILTTPYFVPDDSLLRAMRGAAARGVAVSMIVPEKVDSLLTRYASRSFYDELMDCGVKIYLYRKGLLHTKSITADRRISMFGTVNLDMRSLWINYEVAAFVYGREFGEHLQKLQQSYIDDSDLLIAEEWAKRSDWQRFLENTFRLTSPVL